MSPGLPLEELGSNERERRLLRRIGLVVLAVVVGATGGVGGYVWADARIGKVEDSLSAHLADMNALRPQMEAYVREERQARCATARNVFRLCMSSRVECEPVPANCSIDRR